MIDPSKDKFAYFKDNIQTAEDKEDFDASQYYYHRDELPGQQALPGTPPIIGSRPYAGVLGQTGGAFAYNSSQAMGNGIANDLSSNASAGLQNIGAPPQNVFSGLNGNSMIPPVPSGSFLPSSATRTPPTAPAPLTPESYRVQTTDPVVSAVKSKPAQSETKPPDLSEFPALGARMAALDAENLSESAARLRASPSSEFVIQKEDFPALSSFASVTDNRSTPGKSASSPTPNLISRAQQNDQDAPFLTSNGTQEERADTPVKSEQSPEEQAEEEARFGLLGMLNTVVREKEETKNSLSLGTDLTALGLNLNSTEPLYATFSSPFSSTPVSKTPQFVLPACYANQPPQLKTTHLAKFHLETLLYIFYILPKDVLQACAAQELYSREWRYHGESKIWVKRATPADAALLASSVQKEVGQNGNGSPTGGVGAIGQALAGNMSVGGDVQENQYLYFDVEAWERRAFTGDVDRLLLGLLSEEDVRVKFAS